MTDGLVLVTYERHAQPDERVVIEPRERPGPDYWRVEQVANDGMWRTRGRDAIHDIIVEDERP